MITYSLVPFTEISDFIAKNQDQHFADLVEAKEGEKQKVDWDYHFKVSEAGMSKAVVAYDDEQPVGYAWYTITNHSFYKDKWMATNEAIWVNKEYRDKVDIVEQAEIGLKKLGVDEICYIFGSDALGRMMQRKGYKKKQVIWSK